MGTIAIHGFGRIGRTLMRIGLERNLFTPVAVSDIKDLPTLAALFSVDTIRPPVPYRRYRYG